MKKIQGSYLFGFFDFRLFKTNYCPKCGQKYKIKYLSYRVYLERKYWITYETYVDAYYYCSKCDFYISYKNQKNISNLQKQNNSLILSRPDDIINATKVPVKKMNKIYVYDNPNEIHY